MGRCNPFHDPTQVGCNVLSGNVLETPMGWEIASIACALLVSWQQVLGNTP